MIAGANYAFSPGIVGKLGYRVVAFDYSEQNFAYDMLSPAPTSDRDSAGEDDLPINTVLDPVRRFRQTA